MTEFNNHVKEVTKNSQAKRIFLPALVLGTSIYYSFLFTGGIILGYFLSKIFCNVFWKKGRVSSVWLDYGTWQVHLHHWIMGFMVLGAIWVIDFFYLPTFFAGVIGGIIIQDIYDYNDWYKVVFKKAEYQKKK